MKKRIVIPMVAACILLAGCTNKEEIANEAEQAMAADERAERFYEFNEYRTITDTELVDNYGQFGFDKDFSEDPSSFFFNMKEYTTDDFSTVEKACETLEHINAECPLLDTYTFLLTPMGNAAESFRQELNMALTEPGSTCAFKFDIYSTEEDHMAPEYGYLSIEFDSVNGEFPTAATAWFYGNSEDALTAPVLVFKDKELNVRKTAEVGPYIMMLADYVDMEELSGEINEDVIQEEQEEPLYTEQNYEQPIMPGLLFLDIDIDPMPEAIDDATLTGVTTFEVVGQYVHKEDLTSLLNTVASAIRIGHVLRGEYLSGDMLSQISDVTTYDDIKSIIDAEGSIEISYYEFSGGNCRVVWTITPNTSKVVILPTGEETTPRSRVYYNGDYNSPWIPYKYRHVMEAEF